MRSFFAGTVLATSLLAACGEVKPTNDVDARPIDAIDAFEGTARLSIDRDRADLGMVVVGQTSAPFMFTITNPGDAETGALAVTVTGDGFAASNDRCNGRTLAPAASCQVSVTLMPTQAGTPTGMLRVTADPGGMVSATLGGTALTPGALSVNPMAHDFGNVTLNTTSMPKTFTFTNGGGSPTGTLGVALGGADAAAFQITGDMCTGMALAAGGTCDVNVRMNVGSAVAPGAKTATLTAMGNPGGAAVANLMGNAQSPATITLGGTGAFGDLLIGMMATRTITVTNTGQATSGAVMITRNGAAAFSILGGMAGDCVSGTTTLAGGAMCNIRVQFAPMIAGALAGNLMISANPGGGGAVVLSGNGQRPATLTANIAQAPFGLVEVGVLSTNSFAWIIRNDGDVPSSVPMYSSTTVEIDTTAGNTCNAAIMPGGTCTVTLKFKPSLGGNRMGTATVSITGSMVQLTATATGGFRVTLTRNGGGGTVTSNPAGMNCAPPANTCSAVYAPGNVVMQGRTTNGSGFHFSGWSGASAGACSGFPDRDCTIVVDAVEAITATFSAITSNLVFVSSTNHAMNLGGTAPYDAACNAAATAAGINNAGNNAFTAWISDANSLALNRLGNATGWVRMDGRPFSTTRIGMTNGQILNPVRFSETGEDLGDATIITGTNEDGTSSTFNCSNWTINAAPGAVTFGNTFGGTSYWTGNSTGQCSANTFHVMCMMRTLTVVPTVTTYAGKKVWLTSSGYVSSPANTPDTLCNNERPMGVNSGRAIIGRTTSAASSVLGANQMYVRLDGQEVGTGAEIATNTHRAGIYQNNAGTYVSNFAWSGSAPADQVGAVNSTCNNWTDVTQTGRQVLPGFGRRMFGANFLLTSCNVTAAQGPRVMCYEP